MPAWHTVGMTETRAERIEAAAWGVVCFDDTHDTFVTIPVSRLTALRAALEEPVPKPKLHYSGPTSRAFWKAVDALGNGTEWDEAYAAGVELQNLEERVLKMLPPAPETAIERKTDGLLVVRYDGDGVTMWVNDTKYVPESAAIERRPVEEIAREFAVKWNWNHVTWGQQDWIDGRDASPDDDTAKLAETVGALLRAERGTDD